MRLMNQVLKLFYCKFAMVYVDDSFIYSIDLVTQLEHLRMVIGLLWRNKLYSHLKKCSFLHSNME